MSLCYSHTTRRTRTCITQSSILCVQRYKNLMLKSQALFWCHKIVLPSIQYYIPLKHRQARETTLDACQGNAVIFAMETHGPSFLKVSPCRRPSSCYNNSHLCTKLNATAMAFHELIIEIWEIITGWPPTRRRDKFSSYFMTQFGGVQSPQFVQTEPLLLVHKSLFSRATHQLRVSLLAQGMGGWICVVSYAFPFITRACGHIMGYGDGGKTDTF